MSFSKLTEKYNSNVELKNNFIEIIISPLKIFAILLSILGLTSIAADYFISGIFDLQVIIPKIVFTVIPIVVMLMVNYEFGKKQFDTLLHILLASIIITTGFLSFIQPDLFSINAFATAFALLGFALFIGWNHINFLIHTALYLVLSILIFLLNSDVPSIETSGILQLVLILLIVIFSFFGNMNLFALRVKSLLSTNDEDIQEENLPEVDEEGLVDKGLKESDLKEMFEESTDGIFQISKDGKMKLVNKAFVKMLAYDSLEILYKEMTTEDLFQDKKERESLFKLLNRQGKVRNYRAKIHRYDGEIFYARLNCRKVTDEAGNLKYYEGNIQDITTQVRKEDESKRAIEKLQKEINDASTASDSAQKSSSVKSQFLASMSHEIRTPMNSVLGFLTLIENELFEDKDELKEFAGNARSSAESLLDIINNILDISKVEAGKMELEDTDFAIRDEVDKVISMVKPNLKEKGLIIKTDYANGFPGIVTGDATRYRQILLNIVGNAVKFTQEGGIKIKIDLTNDKIRKIRTTVVDTGEGIPEDQLDSIFEPYVQSQNKEGKNIKKHQGTGLGLVIAREFTKLMGGDISAKSKPGEGSVFTFTVRMKFEGNTLQKDLEPKVDDEPIDTEKEAALIDSIDINDLTSTDESINEIPKLSSTEKGKRRLLLVEDNPISQNVELRILREVGYAVDPVSNGFDAIEAVKTGKFDLVLMDVEMAEMDGLTATKKIRQFENDISTIPIIAVTANSSMKDREKCLAAGMNDYIAKPININFLKMTIDQWLNKAS